MECLNQLKKITSLLVIKRRRHSTPASQLLDVVKVSQIKSGEDEFTLKFIAWALALMFILTTFSLAGLSLINYFDLMGRLNRADVLFFFVTSSGLTSAWFYIILKKRNKDLLQISYANAVNNVEVFSLLSKLVELRDPDTSGHNLRVTLLTIMFCEALKLPPDILVRTAKGAVLHDIGKVVVPDCILGKPGSLTNNERIIMQQHVKNGIKLIAESGITYEALHVVSGHHEKYDGSGYPFGLKGRDIPLEARIFTIIDVFDALVSKRVYKAALSCDEAIKIMSSESGTHFDPVLLEQFIGLASSFVVNIQHDNAELKSKIQESLLKYFQYFSFSIN